MYFLAGGVKNGNLVHLKNAGDVGDRIRQAALKGVVEKKRASESVQLLGFPAAALGFEGTPLRSGRKLAGSNRSDQECKQGNPVLGVLDRKLTEWRQEEKIEGEHACDRGGDRLSQPPHRRNEQYGKQERQGRGSGINGDQFGFDADNRKYDCNTDDVAEKTSKHVLHAAAQTTISSALPVF